MGAELAFENLLIALEATRGTAIAAPVRNLAMRGTLTPRNSIQFPDEARGTLVRNYRKNITREWAEFETEDTAIDLNSFQTLLAMAVRGGVTPTTPEAGVSNWRFTRSLAADNLKSATLWWGDPSVQILQAAYAMIDELTIKADGSGEDEVMISVKGMAQKETKVTAPTVPAVGSPLVCAPANLDVWADTSSAFGTTKITSKIVSVEHSIPTNVTYKNGPVGQGATSKSFRRIGRDKSFMTTKITLEFLDTAEYDFFRSGADIKLRCQYNTFGLIGATQYGFLRIDSYGPLQSPDWGDLEGTNRTVTFTQESMFESGMGVDYDITLQNTNSTP